MTNPRGLSSRAWIFALNGAMFLLSWPLPLLSQAVYGTIRGTVTTKSGEGLAGATIVVTSVQKGSKQRVTSDSSGSFTVTHLLPDDYYDIRAEASGYVAQEVQGEPVSSDSEGTLKFPLEKGSGTAVFQVVSAGSLLKTDRADVSTTLSLQEVQDLPNFSRNFTSYELLAPGALPNAQVSVLRPEQNPQQGLQINQNGQHFSRHSFTLSNLWDLPIGRGKALMGGAQGVLNRRSRLQFRMDVQNVFNRVNLGPPNPIVDNGPATISNLASGATMRQFEVALKLQF